MTTISEPPPPKSHSPVCSLLSRATAQLAPKLRSRRYSHTDLTLHTAPRITKAPRI